MEAKRGSSRCVVVDVDVVMVGQEKFGALYILFSRKAAQAEVNKGLGSSRWVE